MSTRFYTLVVCVYVTSQNLYLSRIYRPSGTRASLDIGIYYCTSRDQHCDDRLNIVARYVLAQPLFRKSNSPILVLFHGIVHRIPAGPDSKFDLNLLAILLLLNYAFYSTYDSMQIYGLIHVIDIIVNLPVSTSWIHVTRRKYIYF